MKKIAISILSGGLDSCTSTAVAINEGYEVIALHFNYHQKTEQKELEAARKIAEFYGIKLHCANTDFFRDLGGTSLVDEKRAVGKNELGENAQSPLAHSQNHVPDTYVPFRNGIFISLAAALCEKYNASTIFLGLVEPDSSSYPDTSESFAAASQEFISCGTGRKIEIKTPLIKMKKSEIITLAKKLNAPLKFSYSCYDGKQKACGKCESCRLRLRGFAEAGLRDEIEYEKE